MQKLVRVIDIAAEFGKCPKGFRRVIETYGFTPVQLTKASNSPLYLSVKDADSFRKKYWSAQNIAVPFSNGRWGGGKEKSPPAPIAQVVAD